MRFSCFTPMGHLRMSGAKSRVEQWYELLPRLWGTQLDFSQKGSYNEETLYARARMLALMGAELEHSQNQGNPEAVYELLPLKELDYELVPGAADSVDTRRAALAAAMSVSRGASAPNVVNTLKTLFGATFLAYVPNPAGTPTVQPTNPGAGPGAFKDVRVPPKVVRLVDPVASPSSPLNLVTQWVAYQALDPSSLPTITWQAGATYAVGQQVLPATSNGFFYACSVAGAAGSSEPVWLTTPGSTVQDGSITWTCAASIAPLLAVGDVLVIDGGNTSQMETVTVARVSTTLPTTTPGCTPGYLYFAAHFTRSHDIGAPATTGDFPYWWSTQRLAYVVLAAASAVDPPTRARVMAQLAKLSRAVDQFAVVEPATKTSSGGTVGPCYVAGPMGAAPLGTFSFTNSV
jgi:hypothetical protein